MPDTTHQGMHLFQELMRPKVSITGGTSA